MRACGTRDHSGTASATVTNQATVGDISAGTNANDFRANSGLKSKFGREMSMRRRRSAKIVATLGPATSTPDRIRALFDAGVDVFRLNFSHGTREDHRTRIEAIRAVEGATGRPIGILADLQGPK